MKKRYIVKIISILLALALLLTGCSMEGLPFLTENGSGSDDGSDRQGSGSDDGSGRQGSGRGPERDANHLRPEKLTFDEFIQEIFLDSIDGDTVSLHFTLAEPEAYGITPGEITFGGYGYGDKKQSLKDLREVKRQLNSYDQTLLDREQRITKDILNYYIDISEEDIGLDYYAEPFSPQTGAHVNIPYLMAEYAFYDRQDVEDYLVLLTKLGEYFDEIMKWEREKADEGLAMSDELLDQVLEECQAFVWDGDEDFLLVSTFRERLDGLQSLTEEEKKAYEDRQRAILENEFSDAYRRLSGELEKLKGKGSNEMGVCYFPEGDRYYEYLIKKDIGMTYGSVDELFDAIVDSINDIYTQVNSIVNGREDIYDQWMNEPEDGREPAEMLEDLRERILEDFPNTASNSSYRIKKVPEAMEDMVSPAFYMIPPIDRYDDNNIYINEGKLNGGYNLYSVLAHEGYPGHLYQTVTFAGTDACDLRKLLSFGGFSEGWGTYAEFYSYRYMDYLPVEVRRLDCLEGRLNLALSATLDIGVNYFGWDRDYTAEVIEYLTGMPGKAIVDDMFNYLISSPAEYLNYYVGCMEIEKMEQEARQTLGYAYQVKEFHRFLLEFGSAPFTVIRPYFEEWLKEQESGAPLPEVQMARSRGGSHGRDFNR